MREVIQQVIAAEEEAKSILAKARSERDLTMADAQRQARGLMEQASQEARIESEKMLAAAQQAADRERQQRLSRSTDEIETQVRIEDATMQCAARAVVQCVCGKRQSVQESP